MSVRLSLPRSRATSAGFRKQNAHMKLAVVTSLMLLVILCVCTESARVSTNLPIAVPAHKEAPHAYVVFKYTVKPDRRKAFIDGWLKLRDATKKEKDNVVFNLKLAYYGNLDLWGYGEWTSESAFLQHYNSDARKQFLDVCAQHDIPWVLDSLDQPSSVEVAPKQGQEGKGPGTHAVLTYRVPPSAAKAFLEAWDTYAKATEAENGIQTFALRRVITSNTQYYVFGVWESFETWGAHFGSAYAHDFEKAMDDNNIIYNMTPLFVVDKQLG